MTPALAILALLKAKPDKADELDSFLRSARDTAAAEEGTVTWYSFRVDETTFGVFDTFAGEEGRQAHLNGEVAAQLGEKAGEWLVAEPDIKLIDLIAVK